VAVAGCALDSTCTSGAASTINWYLTHGHDCAGSWRTGISENCGSGSLHHACPLQPADPNFDAWTSPVWQNCIDTMQQEAKYSGWKTCDLPPAPTPTPGLGTVTYESFDGKGCDPGRKQSCADCGSRKSGACFYPASGHGVYHDTMMTWTCRHAGGGVNVTKARHYDNGRVLTQCSGVPIDYSSDEQANVCYDVSWGQQGYLSHRWSCK
jgi:hypothetical protein